MKLNRIILAACILGITTTSCQKHIERANLKNSSDTLSYALGYTKGASIANSLKRELAGGDTLVNKDIMIAGFINAMKGDKANSQMTEDEARNVIQEYFKDIEARRVIAESDAYQKVKAQNDKYMEERAKEKGMVTLPKIEKYDGPSVLVKEIQPGKGDTIGVNDYVYLTISNKLSDGQAIFCTPEDEPAMMPVEGLVKGLKQGLCTLRQGSVATIVVPSEMAYGRQTKNGIPANSIMVFDVSIVKIFHKEIEARAFMRQEKEKRAAAKAANATALNPEGVGTEAK